MLEPGMKVPDFTLHDANGNAVSLHDRPSKTVVYRSIPRAVFIKKNIIATYAIRGYFYCSCLHYSQLQSNL